MSMFEQTLIILCAAAIAVTLLVAYWYRPRPEMVVASVFGPTKVEYEAELHKKDLELIQARQELTRAHDRMGRMAGQLEDMVDRWLTQSVELATTQHRLTVSDRRLRWNRARVRKLTPTRSNVIEFPRKVVAA